MDKEIKAHFKKSVKSPKQKKLLKKVLKADEKLDKSVHKDDKK
jgi:hypothetical protein